jgi:hypothetical protein
MKRRHVVLLTILVGSAGLLVLTNPRYHRRSTPQLTEDFDEEKADDIYLLLRIYEDEWRKGWDPVQSPSLDLELFLREVGLIEPVRSRLRELGWTEPLFITSQGNAFAVIFVDGGYEIVAPRPNGDFRKD